MTVLKSFDTRRMNRHPLVRSAEESREGVAKLDNYEAEIKNSRDPSLLLKAFEYHSDDAQCGEPVSRIQAAQQ
jgi:hypothetical protein